MSTEGDSGRKSRDSRVMSLGARLLGGSLSADVLADVRRRLQIASLACFLALLVVLCAHFVLVRLGMDQYHRTHVFATSLAAALSLAAYAAFRFVRFPPERLLNFAHFAEWQLCISLSHMEILGPDGRDPHTFSVSIVCVVMVLAPVLIPAPP